MKRVDCLIVGAGLFGAVAAQQLLEQGKSVLVLDKRAHVGGNVYTETVEGVEVHRYGAHIFHTNDKAVWEYVNRFASFNRFVNLSGEWDRRLHQEDRHLHADDRPGVHDGREWRRAGFRKGRLRLHGAHHVQGVHDREV